MNLDYGVIGLWMGQCSADFIYVLLSALILLLSDWQKSADDSIQRIMEEERENETEVGIRLVTLRLQSHNF